MRSRLPLPQVTALGSFASATSKLQKAFLVVFSVAVVAVGGGVELCGQSVLDDFDPSANSRVNVVVVQPDGKILIGGYFTTLSPNGAAAVTRNFIARLNPDGTLDTSFNPSPNGPVFAIAMQEDGKILAGGFFSTIGGQERNLIARLDPTTGLADSFDPGANGDAVYAIAIQPNGKILVGGAFADMGGAHRNYIARLDGTTGLADSFDPNANHMVQSIAVQGDGKILAGGTFNSIGGQTRTHMARLDATTGLADSFEPNAESNVLAIAIQGDGRILSGGFFRGANSIGGQTRNRIARLDATTGLADSFDPNAFSDAVLAIAIQPDGKILVGGAFVGIGGQTRNRIARLDPVTGFADSFSLNANGEVHSIAVQPDGKILVGGHFTSIGGQPRNKIARVLPDSSLPTSKAINLSTRTRVQTGDNVGIGGFIITGVTPKHVLLRAIGPSLTGYGLVDVLQDPVLELHGPGAFVTITNDNSRDTQEAAIRATGIPPTNDFESAIDATLAPGAYTAIVRGKNSSSGTGLIEVYDLNEGVNSKLANLSTRAFINTGQGIVIGGLVLSSGDSNSLVLRGIGPSLAPGSLPASAVLADPVLELRDHDGTLVLANNDWQDDPVQAAQITQNGLRPGNNRESAMAATLPPGLYTVLLAGLNNGTGIGAVEVYEFGIPQAP